MSTTRDHRVDEVTDGAAATSASPTVAAARAGSMHLGPPVELAARYRRAAETGDREALAGIFRSDVLVDTHVPNWRFQLQGRARAAERACVLPRPGRFTTFETEPTDRGLQLQFEWRQGASEMLVRQLHWWRLVDGQIAEQLVFCAGVWDRRLQASMAAKAPLVRP